MKWKRFLAALAVIIILALYFSTLAFALSGNPNAKNMLAASLFCTIALPCVFYAYQLWYRHIKKLKDSDEEIFSEK